MDQKDRETIRKNRTNLRDNVAYPDEVIELLFERGVFTAAMKQKVEAQMTAFEKTLKILDFLPMRGKQAFDKFYQILKDTNNDDAAGFLKPTPTVEELPIDGPNVEAMTEEIKVIPCSQTSEVYRENWNNSMKADNKPKLKQLQPKQPAAKGEKDEASVHNFDNICIFCGERNESFTEEGLDLHYWNNCPMLKACANCEQVFQIASYKNHLLSDCESKATYSRCSRSTESIPKVEYDQHVANKACNAAKHSMNHCRLGYQNISAGEDGWIDHLIGKDGCKKNSRRLLALIKQPPKGGKTTMTTANRGKTKPLAKKKAK